MEKVTDVVGLGQVYRMGEHSFLASCRVEGRREQRYYPTLTMALMHLVRALGAREGVSTGALSAHLAAMASPPSTPPAPPAKLCQDAVAEFLADLAPSVVPATVHDYRLYLSRLDGGMDGLTTTYCRRWIDLWDGKPTSQQHALRALSAWWNWCVERGYADRRSSPLDSLGSVRRALRRKLARRTRTVAVWSPETMEAVYREALRIDPRIRGWFVACAWLGLRPAEAMRVSREDLRPDRLVVPPEKAKSSQGRFRTIPFSGPLEAVGRALQGVEWFDGALVPWRDPKAPGRIVTAAAEAAGAERGHDVLRHSCATYLSALVGEA